MSGVNEAEVLAALRKVIDPDKGKDIVSLGMISGMQLREGHVLFAIEVERQRGPKLEPLRREAEKAIEALPGVLSVSAVLTAEKAPATAETRAPAQPGPRAAHGPHGAPAQSKPLAPGVRAIIAVASGKGGVGKSTTAVNLAYGLASLGLRVGILDADIYGPSIPRLMGVSGKPLSDGKMLEPLLAQGGVKCMSMGFLVAEDTPMIWRGPMVQSALQQMLRDVNWGELDVMVVDMPPGTGDAQLTMAQQVPLKGAVIVSTPQDIALIDARKGIAMFEKTQVPVLGMVENMSMFVCPNCGHESHIFGHGGARATAEKLGVPFLGEIPLVPSIRETSDAGTPIVALHPESREALAFSAVARAVAGRIAGPVRAAPRIVME